MLLVLRITDRLQELLVAPDPGNVLWWTGPFASQTAWVGDAWLRREDLFDVDPMLPVVAEVVQVAEGGASVWSDSAQRRRLRTPDRKVVLGTGLTERHATD